MLSGDGEQEGVGSACWTRAGALQVLGWEHLGAGARLAVAALTPNFLCPQRRDWAHRYLHRPGLPPEDGEGRGEGGCVSLRAEAAGAASQHGADQGEESYLLPAQSGCRSASHPSQRCGVQIHTGHAIHGLATGTGAAR